MSTVQSGNPVLAPAPAVVEDPSKHWTRHGPVLTACLVGINLLMVLLIFFYFWRFFSGKRGPLSSSSSSSSTMAGGGDEEEGASSSADTSPAAASPGRHQQDREDVASSLPVFVYSSSAASYAGDAGGSGKVAAECAVCIVEFRDGDRARLLPRCGHRFHADCVGAWLQLHSTCPLCRATVLLPAAASSEPAKNEPKDDDCPV